MLCVLKMRSVNAPSEQLDRIPKGFYYANKRNEASLSFSLCFLRLRSQLNSMILEQWMMRRIYNKLFPRYRKLSLKSDKKNVYEPKWEMKHFLFSFIFVFDIFSFRLHHEYFKKLFHLNLTTPM